MAIHLWLSGKGSIVTVVDKEKSPSSAQNSKRLPEVLSYNYRWCHTLRHCVVTVIIYYRWCHTLRHCVVTVIIYYRWCHTLRHCVVTVIIYYRWCHTLRHCVVTVIIYYRWCHTLRHCVVTASQYSSVGKLAGDGDLIQSSGMCLNRIIL